jgi:hypothetical protein
LDRGVDGKETQGYVLSSWRAKWSEKSNASWSLCGRHAGPGIINLDNVLSVERQGDLATVVMVGGEKVYIDTMPETFIGTVAPAGPV